MLVGKPIPGETPIDDVSGLKVKGITTRGELSVFEAENIRKAVARYMSKRPTPRQAPFDLKWVKKLHKQMFGDVWKWAGKFRTSQTNIGVPPLEIETRLYELLHNLLIWGEYGTSLLGQSARLHHQAVQIHPFNNGNGRWSRLLANIWLSRNSHPPTQWPEETIGDESLIRGEYLAAIRAADQGDEEPLLVLHQRHTLYAK